MQYVNLICPDNTCGVPCQIPEHVYNQARQNADRWIYCSNGHRFHYKESESDRLRKRLDEERAANTTLSNEIDSLRRTIERNCLSIRYWRGIATRWKLRASKTPIIFDGKKDLRR